MIKISGLILKEMSRFLTEFKDFVKNTDFDESFPKYNELLEVKDMLEKLEKEIKSRQDSLFEFKI